MNDFLIENEDDYARALDLIDKLWNSKPDSPEAKLLHLMAARVQEYEAPELWAILPPPDPEAVAAFKLRMEKLRPIQG